MIVGNLSSLLRWQERNFIVLMLLPGRVTPCHDFTSQDLKLWGSVLQRCFTVPSKGISNDRDRGNSPVVVIWFSIVILSRFSDSLNCDWKKAQQRGVVECMGIFLCSWNFSLWVEINGEWALSQGYTEARGGQEHILKDVVDNRADTLINKKRYETLYKEAIV